MGALGNGGRWESPLSIVLNKKKSKKKFSGLIWDCNGQPYNLTVSEIKRYRHTNMNLLPFYCIIYFTNAITIFYCWAKYLSLVVISLLVLVCWIHKSQHSCINHHFIAIKCYLQKGSKFRVHEAVYLNLLNFLFRSYGALFVTKIKFTPMKF